MAYEKKVGGFNDGATSGGAGTMAKFLRSTSRSKPKKESAIPTLRQKHDRTTRSVQRLRQDHHISAKSRPPLTLVVDVGASGIKAALINELGDLVGKRVRQDTPPSGMPSELMDTIATLANDFESFDRVAVGFPGIIIDGIVKQAPNLAPEWKDFNLTKVLQVRLKRPVRVANDADVQGFGAIVGKGVELVVTLGTGVGTSLFTDGHLVPNLEVGKDKLRNERLQKDGKKKWNRRLAKFVRGLEAKFHFTRLYLGGGNAKEVDISLFPANVTIVSNLNGVAGGIALWRDEIMPMGKRAVDPEPVPVAKR